MHLQSLVRHPRFWQAAWKFLAVVSAVTWVLVFLISQKYILYSPFLLCLYYNTSLAVCQVFFYFQGRFFLPYYLSVVGFVDESFQFFQVSAILFCDVLSHLQVRPPSHPDVPALCPRLFGFFGSLNYFGFETVNDFLIISINHVLHLLCFCAFIIAPVRQFVKCFFYFFYCYFAQITHFRIVYFFCIFRNFLLDKLTDV